jgi:imidazolonepropionase-like amidohydrolase
VGQSADRFVITVFRNARVWDGHSAETLDGGCVVVENDRIREVSQQVALTGSTGVDCGGRFLLPGLIDAHFHACSPSFDIFASNHLPPSLMASHAAKVLTGALQRGFTTVRDAAGGDVGLALAIEQGLIAGPRFFFSGKALSQTGGHGDDRPGHWFEPCACAGHSGYFSVVTDGPDAVRAAAREELRKGAHQIKIFASGGVLSPTDPMWMDQFTPEEIRAAVEEAQTRRTYVMAHSHTDEGAKRCAELGVRTIEHGTLIHRESTAHCIREHGAYVVPTLSVADVLSRHAHELSLPPMAIEKLRGITESMHRSIEVCARAGVQIGFGTDLLDHRFHPHQGGEFELRGESMAPLDVLRSATSVNAEILQKAGELGCIRPGAYADLLVLGGDPFKDLSLFRNSESNIRVIMKGGVFVRNSL